MIGSRVTPLSSSALSELQRIVGAADVLTDPADRIAFECDGTTVEKLPPCAIVFVSSTHEVQEVVQFCQRQNISFTARGAGTGLSGGALSLDNGLIIELSRMNRILEIDFESGFAAVEPGVVNLDITRAVESKELYYAPDPSSQAACTVGGNIAENSGGPHTLKYGVTTNHVLGLEIVLPDGQVVTTGGETRGQPGYDLTGLFVGSEGTLGIVTRAWVRLLPKPEATRTLLVAFSSIADASMTVSEIIAQGLIPSALELMDRLVCEAVERKHPVGFPKNADAVLLIEVDGMAGELTDEVEKIETICEQHRALSFRIAKDDRERSMLWKMRKGAFGAIGALTKSYYTHDGVIPRSRLPEVLEEISRIGADEGLRIANVFHAGDGNLHPLLLFDERDPDQVRSVQRAGERILRLCVDVGGSLTGEHGIGFEKLDEMSWLFDEDTLALMHGIRLSFDPNRRCNPGKAVPVPGSCGEVKKVLGAKRGV